MIWIIIIFYATGNMNLSSICISRVRVIMKQACSGVLIADAKILIFLFGV